MDPLRVGLPPRDRRPGQRKARPCGCEQGGPAGENRARPGGDVLRPRGGEDRSAHLLLGDDARPRHPGRDRRRRLRASLEARRPTGGHSAVLHLLHDGCDRGARQRDGEDELGRQIHDRLRGGPARAPAYRELPADDRRDLRHRPLLLAARRPDSDSRRRRRATAFFYGALAFAAGFSERRTQILTGGAARFLGDQESEEDEARRTPPRAEGREAEAGAGSTG